MLKTRSHNYKVISNSSNIEFNSKRNNNGNGGNNRYRRFKKKVDKVKI